MTSARDTPNTAATTTAADSPTPLPLAWHKQTEREVDAAYWYGWNDAMHDIAAGHAELDATWTPVGRRAYEERVRERLEQMEQAATKVASSTWRGRYPGGPVDWDTGRLVQRRTAATHIEEAA